jgi:hypothetical protein
MIDEELLARFANGRLSEPERRGLFEAALADQELFDALGEEAALQELLADPEVRTAALSRLRQNAGRRPRFSAWVVPVALAATMTLVVGAWWLRHAASPGLLDGASGPEPRVAMLWQESDTAPIPKALGALEARLLVNGQTQGPVRVSRAERLILEISVSASSRVALLVEPHGGPPQSIPLAGAFSARVMPGPALRIGPSAGLAAPTEPGLYRLRLLAVPDDAGAPMLEPEAMRARVVRGEATVVGLDLEVTP